MNYCPHCSAMFWHPDALAEHRKQCKVWAGEKKKPPPEEEPKPLPDYYFWFNKPPPTGDV